MHGIAMAQAGAIHELSVVIDSAGSVDNFIVPIAIHIGHAQVMISLPVSPRARRRRIVKPTLHQFFIHHIVGRQCSTAVIAPTHDHRRMNAIQISCTGQETVATVVITVAPGIRTTLRIVRYGIQFRAGFSIKKRQVFGAGIDGTHHFGTTGLSGINVSIISSGAIAVHYHIFSLTIHCSGSGAAHEFGQSIAIVIEHLKLGIVRSGTNVFTQIDSPQLGSIQLVAVEIHLSGDAVVGIILRVGRVPFHDDFVFAIAIHIAHATVVGRISVRLPFRIAGIGRFAHATYLVGFGTSFCRPIQLYGFVLSRPGSN